MIASYSEDKYGVVQTSLGEVITTLLKLREVLTNTRSRVLTYCSSDRQHHDMTSLDGVVGSGEDVQVKWTHAQTTGG